MYGKVFSSIFDSTLVSDGGAIPTYIFMSMIALADKDGIVSVASKVLFLKLGFNDHDSLITYDDFLNAIKFLEKEDSESNSSSQNGRRIIPLKEIPEIEGNRGWYIVNYDIYKKKASKSEPQGSAERMRRYRERNKNKDLKKCDGDVTVRDDDVTKSDGSDDSVTLCDDTIKKETKKNRHIDIDLDLDNKHTCEIPFDLIVESYNKHCTNLPQCKKLTPARKSAIRSRWNESEKYQSMDFWNNYFKKINNNDFLTGNNGNSWRADFDFCFKQSKFAKILEGSYGQNKKSNGDFFGGLHVN